MNTALLKYTEKKGNADNMMHRKYELLGFLQFSILYHVCDSALVSTWSRALSDMWGQWEDNSWLIVDIFSVTHYTISFIVHVYPGIMSLQTM